jgi:hypothetical protein
VVRRLPARGVGFPATKGLAFLTLVLFFPCFTRLAYTIARAIFRPINAVFAGAGYQFGGLLKNNTNISGSMESMNVWYRKL